MKEMHIGIKFEHAGDGVYIGELTARPAEAATTPMSVVPSPRADTEIYVWWLDGKVPAEDIRKEIDEQVEQYVHRHLADVG
jgi:hypothetical protein